METVVASFVVLLALNGYEIGLLVVALTFIAFALVVALVVPRGRPAFPGKRLGVFIGICVVFFLAQMSAVFAMAELGPHEEAAEGEPTATQPTETTPTETGPTETTPTETVPTETGPTETQPTETETGGSTALGKEIFVANCAVCHTLADAGTTGAVGPNLDDAAPPLELVVDRVTNGQGAMPSFSGKLSEEEITEVAMYVSSVTGP